MNELNKRSAEWFSSADWIVAPFITALVYIIVRTFLVYVVDGNQNYFSLVFSAGYLLILAAAVFYVKNDRRLNAESIVTVVSCAVLGVSVSLYGDSVFSYLTILLLFVLTSSLCLSLSGSHVFPVSSAYYLADVLYSMTVCPLLNFVPMTKAAFSKRKKGKGISGAILGAVLAVPVLAAVIVLLSKGDAAFENLTTRFTDTLFSGYAFVSVAVSLVLSVYIFTVMYSSRNRLTVPDPEKTKKAVASVRFLTVSVTNGFLGSVSAVYLVYLFSQLTYFFGAFGGSIPGSVQMTVAEYSRRGFFEMSAVAAINLLLIFLAVMFSKRTDGKIAKSVKGFLLFLCGFTEILIMTAMSKMMLYISRYGLTRKRVFVTAAILVLFVTFVCVIIRLFKRNFPYMKIVFCIFLLVYSLLSVVNVDAVIADYNVDAYLSGRLETVDVEMLSGFGMSGLESLMKLARNENDRYSSVAKSQIGEFFTYSPDDLGYFLVDENKNISLRYSSGDVYDYVVFKRVQKENAAYLKILDEVKPVPSNCYVFVSAEKPIVSIRDAYYWAEYDGDTPMEKYKLYEFPVVTKEETVTLFADCCDVNDEDGENGENDVYDEAQYSVEILECKVGGVFEIGEDKDGNIICKSYGEPGIDFSQAQKIMDASKVRNRNK